MKENLSEFELENILGGKNSAAAKPEVIIIDNGEPDIYLPDEDVPL